MKSSKILVLLVAAGYAQLAFSNIIGSDLQNFNATTDGLDFVTVHSSETLAPGVFNLGLFANYAVNTLPRYDTDLTARSSSTSDSILAADFNVGYGITNFWDVGISFPQIVDQKVNLGGSRGEFGQKGLTEIRANSKFRLTGNDPSQGIAFIVSGNFNTTKDNPYAGKNAGPTVNFELAADTTIKKLALGLNIGYRKRSPGEKIPDFPIAPLQDQYLLSAAASYLFTSIDTKFILEYYAAYPTQQTETVSSRVVTSAEALAGIKHDLSDQLALHLGVGTETQNGTASADWRVYVGMNYAFGFEDSSSVSQIIKPKEKKKKKPEPAPVKEKEVPKFMPQQEGPAETPGGDEVFVLRGVNFAFDSASRVLPGTREILSKLAEHLKKNPFDKVIIEGHTDSVGSEQYNQNLGQARANTIKDYLVRVGKFDPNAFEAKSYGETKPIADNGNYQGRQLNRRVVFRLYYKH